jgi:hypothetical protein
LLHLREVCLATTSVPCLGGVDQAGSVAMATDSDRARDPHSTGAAVALTLTAGAYTATVQERRGNAALVTLIPVVTEGGDRHPASALMIKGEAGWRLRELFDY